MKFVVVTVERETDPSKQFNFRYPPEYNAQEIERAKHGPLVYGGGILILDGEIEELLIHLQDEVAAKLLKSPLVRELTHEEANAWLAASPIMQRLPDEKVTDADRVALVSTRAVAGLPLSQDDLDVLNPDHPKSGVTRAEKTVEAIFKVAALVLESPAVAEPAAEK